MRVPSEALRQRITIEKYAGEGALGSTFGAPVSARASVQPTQALVVDYKNDAVSVDTVVIVRPEVGPVDPGSRVTIDGKMFRVVKAFAIPDGHHPSHYELMVHSWAVE